MESKIGILHPGQMGVSVAASAVASGFPVYWVAEGRSLATRQRAAEAHLEQVKTLAELCALCDVILCVCPPHAAEAVAAGVISHGFKGLYVDANAIAPQRVKKIDNLMAAANVDFVDGSIIGGPAWNPGTTWLYLSGQRAPDIAPLFAGGPLETEIIDAEIGSASALKMCFAAYTKGTTALLSAILAAAEGLDVRQVLEVQWSRGGSDFAQQAHTRTSRVTAKAWRFAGEMEEIAATFESVGLPGGFHLAAAEIYTRMAGFKEQQAPPSLETVLAALLTES